MTMPTFSTVPPAPPRLSLSDRLRLSIKSSGVSLTQLAQRAGIAKVGLCRFVAGRQGVRLDLADKIRTVLGLELVRRGRPNNGSGERLSLAEEIRVAIRSSGRSLFQLSRESGVILASLSRFMRGLQDLGLDIADKLCAALGLELVQGALPRPATPGNVS
jgi:transcriptional regulator with XRE-family HTH domain